MSSRRRRERAGRAEPTTQAEQPGASPPRVQAQPPALRIDALGKKCPIPIIMLAERIGEVPIGRLVEVLADDPAARTDVPAWCGLKSHDLIAVTDLADVRGWAFLVRRSY